ncbi:MAG: NrfD/PsrC family molybdoenzyme membrane anchor subunit [Campylobacter sputorum]|uniref:NrfD/PsrC family molybdoenzyme membrane anchor subunit n=1 Tax=Campylobacter sputorum TaxID=206 RepID=UPI000B7762C1|nr:NrfD/PsrC family molybdoenzyme membrane anchor subunit [Campylobacter sputorum]ASM38417.1 reductase-associated membrane protein [Campylobacter sputorum bv. paraureolyticus LMG 11764]MDY6120772.1 NrfD/PsrC family molybdoenzyme membrane anchor subunit [Campylobacter sputorum]
MEQTTWGWLIVIYLFLGGLGSGAFLCSVLAYKGYLGNLDEKFYKFGFFLAPVAVIAGTILLLLDLAPSAAINPLAIIKLYSHPTSMMSLGTYLLTFFIIVSALVLFWLKNKKALNDRVLFLGSLLALGVMGYTGLLLYAIKAIPLWASIWVPIIFTISAISTGLSANSAYSLNKDSELTHEVHTLHNVLIILEIVAIIFLFASVSSELSGLKSITKIMSGSLAFVFWIGFILVGLLLPLIGGSKYIMKAKNSQAVVEVKSCVYSEYAILIGGFCLRVFVIFGAFYIF